MSFQINSSFRSVGLPHHQQQQQHQQHQQQHQPQPHHPPMINTHNTHNPYYATPPPPAVPTTAQVPQTATAAAAAAVTPHSSMHQRFHTSSSSGMAAALEAMQALTALDAHDFSERRITSDISTLECESVKADPHFDPAVEDLPFVPPLEISIPVNLEHLAVQQKQQRERQRQEQQQQKKKSGAASTKKKANTATRRASFSSQSPMPLHRPLDLVRQASCQSRLEMSQASPHPRTKALYASSHTMRNKAHHPTTPNTAAQQQQQQQQQQRPSYAQEGGANHLAYVQQHQDPNHPDCDPSLQDYANGAGAVTWDEQSRLSYYTSPTDLYTSDDSDPIPLRVVSPVKKSLVQMEWKKLKVRFSRKSKRRQQRRQQQQQRQAVNGDGDGVLEDYDSFGSERGFC